MNLTYDTFDTPCGDFSIALNESGAVAATTFGNVDALRRGSRFAGMTRDEDALAKAREQVLAYFAGELREFDLPLAAAGRPFQIAVWGALSAIPYGETRSYAQIAAQVGNARACRAVGRVNGTNPICLIVPCHRVIGANGSLTGFSGGLSIKKQLLELEASCLERSDYGRLAAHPLAA